MADRALTSAAYTAPVPAETVSILTTDPRIALRREREHAAAPRWSSTTVRTGRGQHIRGLSKASDLRAGAVGARPQRDAGRRCSVEPPERVTIRAGVTAIRRHARPRAAGGGGHDPLRPLTGPVAAWRRDRLVTLSGRRTCHRAMRRCRRHQTAVRRTVGRRGTSKPPGGRCNHVRSQLRQHEKCRSEHRNGGIPALGGIPASAGCFLQFSAGYPRRADRCPPKGSAPATADTHRMLLVRGDHRSPPDLMTNCQDRPYVRSA
jgi:hypothetical protein